LAAGLPSILQPSAAAIGFLGDFGRRFAFKSPAVGGRNRLFGGFWPPACLPVSSRRRPQSAIWGILAAGLPSCLELSAAAIGFLGDFGRRPFFSAGRSLRQKIKFR